MNSKEISKRAKAWKITDYALTLEGISTNFEKGQIVLMANVNDQGDLKEAKTILSMAQAQALRSLLDYDINLAQEVFREEK